MIRSIALLAVALAMTACTETSSKPAQTPTSTTSITSAPAPGSTTNKPPQDPSEEREESGDSLRN